MYKIVLAAAITLFASSCRYFGGERVRGNGVIKTATRQVSSFSQVHVSGNIDLYLTQDSTSAVSLETDENLLEYIEVFTEGDILVVKTKKGFNLSATKSIKAHIAAPVYAGISASGSCDILTEEHIEQSSDIKIDLSGSSEVNMDIKAPKIAASLSGSGELSLKGETRDLKVHGSGSTGVKSTGLMAENVDLAFSGSGDAEVYASANLQVSVSGSADVKYTGNPAVKQSISGSGSVKKID